MTQQHCKALEDTGLTVAVGCESQEIPSAVLTRGKYAARMGERRETGKPVIGLSGADLRGVNLKELDLRGAKLNGVDLKGVDLRGADLGVYEPSKKAANLADADLSHTNLWNAKGITYQELERQAKSLAGATISGLQ